MVKNPPANAGDARVLGSIPESERSSREGNGNPSSILAWKIHGQRSQEGYSSWGHKELDTTEYVYD